MKKYDKAVFIGRFSPVTKAHTHIVKEALKHAEEVIILIGSSFEPQTERQPFSYETRENLFNRALDEEKIPSYLYSISAIADHKYDDSEWRRDVLKKIASRTIPNDTVTLVGYDKDETSAYLKWFPELPLTLIPTLGDLAATYIRQLLFSPQYEPSTFLSQVKKLGSHDCVAEFLLHNRELGYYNNLIRNIRSNELYKAQWGIGPHLTSDAMCTYFDEILLITRKDAAEQKLLALPGGFLNKNERFIDAAYRELYEETGLEINIKPKRVELFDAPTRDPRARIITSAYHFELSERPPVICAGDDAAEVGWFKIKDLSSDLFYADHYHVIQFMLKAVQ